MSTRPPSSGPGRPPAPSPSAPRIYGAAAGSLLTALAIAWFVPLGSAMLGVLVAASAGMTVFVMVVPWPHLVAGEQRMRGVDRLAARASEVAESGDRERLPDPAAERDPALARLAQSIVALGRRIDAESRRHRHLERTLDHEVGQRTRRATAVLQREVSTDPLTGLGNRRRLEESLAAFFTGAGSREGDVVACVAIDMDKFKQVNDVLGHAVGDECLTFVGQLLRSTLRGEDVPVRLGGDEFVVLLPGLDEASAARVASRIVELHGRRVWPHDGAPAPTLSAGVACVSVTHADGADVLLHRADAALYAMKDGGRNGVSVWSLVPPARKSA